MRSFRWYLVVMLAVTVAVVACERLITHSSPASPLQPGDGLSLNTAPVPSCTIPAGQVIVARSATQKCGTTRAPLVKLPGLFETVCADSPIPLGYVRISARKNLTNTCTDNQETVLLLPGMHAWICSGSPIPTGYRVASTRPSICGTTAQDRLIVRGTGTSPIGGELRFQPGSGFKMIACQPDHPTRLTVVHLYEGAPYPWGTRFDVDTSGSAIYEEDDGWKRACGDWMRPLVSGDFTPQQMQKLVGGQRVLYAHLLDHDRGVNPVMGPSLVVVGTNQPIGDAPPMGQLVGGTQTGLLYGFSCQLDHNTIATELHVYADAPAGRPGAIALGGTRTAYPVPQQWRWSSYCTNGGFRIQLTTAQLGRLSPGSHTLYVHAIDSDKVSTGPHPLLAGSHVIQR